eukprot:g10184.t1
MPDGPEWSHEHFSTEPLVDDPQTSATAGLVFVLAAEAFEAFETPSSEMMTEDTGPMRVRVVGDLDELGYSEELEEWDPNLGVDLCWEGDVWRSFVIAVEPETLVHFSLVRLDQPESHPGLLQGWRRWEMHEQRHFTWSPRHSLRAPKANEILEVFLRREHCDGRSVTSWSIPRRVLPRRAVVTAPGGPRELGCPVSEAFRHDSQQRSAEAERQRLARSLAGGQRRLAMSLCHTDVVRLQLVFDGWQRFLRRSRRARDFIGGLLSQDAGLCLRLSIYRWRVLVQVRRRRTQAMSKMIYYISQDEVCHRSVLWNAWRLALQKTQAVAARAEQRQGRCCAMQRMVFHFDSTLLMSALFAWHRTVKAAALRKRFVTGSRSLCDTVDGLCQAAQLQAIFTAWVDVLLISQTAAMPQTGPSATGRLPSVPSVITGGMVALRQKQNDGKFFQTTKRGEIQESRARKYL